jgi:hypothetical protein
MSSNLDRNSEQLFIEDRGMTLNIDRRVVWSLRIDQLGIIGEYTTSEGPYFDDHFIVFVDCDGNWFEVTFALARSVWNKLETELGVPLVGQLANCTRYESKVLWPNAIQGAHLFDFQEKPAQNLRQRILGLIGVSTTERVLSQDVLMFIGRDVQHAEPTSSNDSVVE